MRLMQNSIPIRTNCGYFFENTSSETERTIIRRSEPANWIAAIFALYQIRRAIDSRSIHHIRV